MKRVLALVLTLVMAVSALALPGQASDRFTDVGSGDWFDTAVTYCSDHGMVNGTSDNTFSPLASVTRAQFVTILGRMDGVRIGSGATDFTDVPADSYYAPYVAWASRNGIVNGTSATLFSPDEPILREQMAAMIVRYLACRSAKLPDAAAPAAAFSDSDEISAYAAESVELLRRCGLLEGANGKAEPKRTLTRAEGAAVLMRLRDALLSAGTSLPDTAGTQLSALHVSGTRLLDESGTPIQLRGVSTHGIAWYPQYINDACFRQLHTDFHANVVRLAMYTAEYGGYCSGGDQAALKALIAKGVEYATENQMYVILDWHILSDGNPNTHADEAAAFFREMAAACHSYTNVLYEICNEPNGSASWSDIKTYAAKVIPAIRAEDPDSVILVGTPTWSQDVGAAAADPLPYDNLLYTLHFYAATHTDSLRSAMVSALDKGLPVFVSEYGICDASGSGALDIPQANTWISLLNRYGVSYVAWNLSNKAESSAILASSCSKTSGFSASDLSPAGKWLLGMMTGTQQLPSAADSGGSGGTGGDTGGTAASGVAVTPTATPVNSWQSGGTYYCQYALTVKNETSSACSSWKATISFDAPVSLENSWNGSFTVSGGTVTVTSADYNGAIAAGGTQTGIGFIISSDVSPKLK